MKQLQLFCLSFLFYAPLYYCADDAPLTFNPNQTKTKALTPKDDEEWYKKITPLITLVASDINHKDPTFSDCSSFLLLDALKRKDATAVKLLLACKANPEEKNGLDETAIFHAWIPIVAQDLAKSKANLGAVNGQGQTCVDKAVYEGQDANLVDCLLTLGAPVNHADHNGHNALFTLATVAPHRDPENTLKTFSALLNHGFTVYKPENPPQAISYNPALTYDVTDFDHERRILSVWTFPKSSDKLPNFQQYSTKFKALILADVPLEEHKADEGHYQAYVPPEEPVTPTLSWPFSSSSCCLQ